MDFEQRLIEAQRLQACGALEQAARALEDLIADCGRRRPALALLGKIRLAQGRREEAAVLMEAALRRNRHREPSVAQLTLGLSSQPDPAASAFIDDDDGFDTEIAAARSAERGIPESVEDWAARADAQTDPVAGLPAPSTPEPGQAGRAEFASPSSAPRNPKDIPLPPPVAPSSATTAQPPARNNGTDPQPPWERTAPGDPGLVPLGETHNAADAEPTLDEMGSNPLFTKGEPEVDDFGDPDDFAAVDELDDGLDGGLEDPYDEADNGLPSVPWYDPDFDPDPIPPSRLATRPALATIPRRERARQIAVQVAVAAAAEPPSNYAWDATANLELLTDIFFCYGWGQSRVSVAREIAAGMSPHELELAFDLRKSWAENPEFAMDFSGARRLPTGTTAERPASLPEHPEFAIDHSTASHLLSGTTAAVYRVISWPLALKMIRSHRAMTDRESIAWALFDLFDDWYSNASHCRRWPSFNLFLYSRFGGFDGVLEEFPEWRFDPDPMLEIDDEENWCPGVGTPTYRQLEQTGLLPGNGAARDFKDQASTGSD